MVIVSRLECFQGLCLNSGVYFFPPSCGCPIAGDPSRVGLVEPSMAELGGPAAVTWLANGGMIPSPCVFFFWLEKFDGKTQGG